MRGYITIDRSDRGEIPVDSQTEIYRDPEESERILADVDDKTIPLGVADVTVSRKKKGRAPVVVSPRAEFIEIRNNGNSNGVTVVSNGEERKVSEGHVETVTRDARISIGYQTDLQLTVEREAKVEQNVVNKGQGDVIMGDSIDKSTSIGDDNVINRSDIGGQGPADVGDDNVINRSDVSGSTAEEAPASNPRDQQTPSDGTVDSGGETQFCIGCGTEVGAHVKYCPNCGQELATAGVGSKSDTQKFCEHHQRTYTGDNCPECNGGRP